MNYAEAIDFLYNLEHGSIKLGLERIEAAIAALDHPERRYLSVHVAGTNGKGTTATFLASILEAAGQRTGCSPHRTCRPLANAYASAAACCPMTTLPRSPRSSAR